ncbi:MAG: amino acid permease [Kiritimatiellae bacterium]|nr:amino acid permease [Kiritimatiellia bacterium]
MKESGALRRNALQGYLSPLQAWALSFGCAVGWGAFVMPGTAFLPVAGPLGTLIGLVIGAFVMVLVGRNYHYLMQNFPEAGGAYGYVRHVFGTDHGYICGWFLVLTYVAIAWANVTALALIERNLFGGMFNFGFSYEIFGFDVFAGEILLAVATLLAAAAVFVGGKRLAVRVQIFFAFVLLAGIAFAAAAVFARHEGGLSALAPAFAGGRSAPLQVFAIVALAPWAFVGFESVSNSAEEFNFPRKRTVVVIVCSLLASTAAYALLALAAASTRPEGFADWRGYMAALGSFKDVRALPVFYAVETALGKLGILVLSLTTIAAIVTGLVGQIVAASRLVYAMSRDGLFWKPLSKLDSDGSPRNAILLIIAVSCLIPFVGRTLVGWIVDVTTVGASIAYTYVSWCALTVACSERRPFIVASGFAGLVVSLSFLVYFLVPDLWVVDALAAESYLILTVWSIVGIVVFRVVFGRDRTGKLGTSTVAWIVLLFFIFFSGHMWNREEESKLTNRVVAEIHERYAPVDKDGKVSVAEAEAADFLERQKEWVDNTLTHYNLVQVVLVLVALLMMYSIYSVVSRREKDAAKAKSYFFSTISHDIRTPLNAIVGFSQMLQLGFKTKEEHDAAVESVLSNSKALLGLVNDILELARFEAGEVEIVHVPTDCRKLVWEVAEAFRTGNTKPDLEVREMIGEMPCLLVDPLRLRHVVVNLVANAVKFTAHGHVEVRARFTTYDAEGGNGTLRIEVEDTGCGISEEDRHKILQPYVRTASKLSRHGGTGFGLSLSRQFVKAMGGMLAFESKPGKGSTFTVTFPMVRMADEERKVESGVVSPTHPLPNSPTSSIPRVLLVDDAKMNLMVLKALVKKIGDFEIETAMDGKEALARLYDPGKPAFDAVLTDMWMPELDGAGLVKAIRADPRFKKMPVHIVTADVELQETFAEKGFDSIILKPVTISLLRPLFVDMLTEPPTTND